MLHSDHASQASSTSYPDATQNWSAVIASSGGDEAPETSYGAYDGLSSEERFFIRAWRTLPPTRHVCRCPHGAGTPR